MLNLTRMKGGKFVLVFAIVFALALFTNGLVVYANGSGGDIMGGDSGGSGGGGGGDVGGSCGTVEYQYAVSCAGVSWIFYEAERPTNHDVTFAPYSRRVGDHAGTADDPKELLIPSECSQHENGGFWHFGVNGQSTKSNPDGRFIVGSDDGEAFWYSNFLVLGSNTWGHWRTWRTEIKDDGTYGSYGVKESLPGQAGEKSGIDSDQAWHVGDEWLGHVLFDEDGNAVYKAKKARLSNDCEVKEAYWKAYKYTHPEEDIDLSAGCANLKPIPAYLNSFCYWDGMAETYFASSNVSNGVGHEPTGLVSNETAPVEKTTKTRKVKTNTDVNLRFSHNIYASAASQEKTNYTLERTGDWNNEGFSIVSGSLNNTSGSVSLDNKVGDLYLPKDSDMVYTDGNNKYLLREDLTVSFLKVGTYTFCESIRLTNSLLSNKLMTKVCAVYEVSPSGPCDMWLPESYFDGKTSVISKVKFYGESDEAYKDEIYAKPTDKVEWVHCYYPGVQRLANSVASTNGWGNSFSVELKTGPSWNKVQVTGSSDEKLIGNYRTGTTTPLTYNGGTYRIGDSSIKYLYDKGSAPTFQGVEVKAQNVGIEIGKSGGGLIEKNKSSAPVEKTLDYFDLALYATDDAKVMVPYNFRNNIEIDLGDRTVFAGETVSVNSVTVKVFPRKNDTLGGTYATRVDNAEVRLISYTTNNDQTSSSIGEVESLSTEGICSSLGGSNCDAKTWSGRTFNDPLALGDNKGDLKFGSKEDTIAYSDKLTGLTLDVNDVAAGTKYCVVAAVYPYTSGSYTEEGDLNVSPSGDGHWYVSAPSCATVAKRPSLQVWGTGLYTTGSVKTGVAEKTNLGGNKLSGSAVVFGSWVETSIFAGGKVEGLASGVATGFAGSTAKTYKDNAGKSFGGSLETNPSSSFCEIRSPLTMPSLACTRSSGGSGGSTTSDGDFISRLDAMKNELGDKFKYVEVKSSRYPDGPNGSYLLSNLLTQENRGSNQIYEGETLVIDAKNQTLTIDIGATYVSGERYDNLSDIPKLIIRAGDINIDCGVERIDAVLIADRTVNGKMVGKVNTCVDGDGNVPDVNNWRRSNPLRIYGTIIAGSLEANRTFGAGTGEYSVIPAEIIDYDTSLYLWSALTDSTSTGDKLETTYIKELPPRY